MTLHREKVDLIFKPLHSFRLKIGNQVAKVQGMFQSSIPETATPGNLQKIDFVTGLYLIFTGRNAAGNK